MKVKIVLVLLGLIVFNYCGEKQLTEQEIDHKTFTVTESKASRFNEVGKIKRIVKLETTNDSLLSEIHSVCCFGNGDFLVGDIDSVMKVMAFDGNGKFLRTYGTRGEGPGEYRRIYDYDLSSRNDVIVLAPDKLIKYAQNGDLLHETRLYDYFREMVIVDDKIYLYLVGNTRRKLKGEVVVLNENFEKVGEFGNYDKRIDKYRYVPFESLIERNGKVYYTSLYDLKLNFVAYEDGNISYVEFPNENNLLDSIWNKKKMAENDYTEIRTKIHRFTNITNAGDAGILLLVTKGRSKRSFWLLNPENNKITVFENSVFECINPREPEDLFFYPAVGSHSDGVIFPLCNPDNFNKFKSNYSEFKDIDFKMEDNPLLLLYEFN